MDKTVTVGKISFTVRSETGNDYIAKQVLYPKLREEDDDEQWRKSWLFIRILVQSSDVAGLKFAWPAKSADTATLKAARDNLFNLSGKLIEKWDRALDEVDLAPASEDDLDLKNEPALPQSSNGSNSEMSLMTTSQGETTPNTSTD